MPTRRSPAVAGQFYPAEPNSLRETIASMLEPVTLGEQIPKAIIAPHAGYVYSGPVAASVYARLQAIERVVLLGPSHRVAYRGLALSHASVFETPLGDIDVDREALARLLNLPQVQILDAAHTYEHSLEVHLPFLQHCLGNFQLIPIVVGHATALEVSQVIDQLWRDEETLVVISTDLSHFLDYDAAVAYDTKTSGLIETCYQQLGTEQACGAHPVNGFLKVAAERGLKVNAVDLRNSGDTAGNRDRVVGYGAFAIT